MSQPLGPDGSPGGLLNREGNRRKRPLITEFLTFPRPPPHPGTPGRGAQERVETGAKLLVSFWAPAQGIEPEPHCLGERGFGRAAGDSGVWVEGRRR